MAGSNATASRQSWHSRFYLVAWGMIALLAAAYLSALIFKPELVERPFGLPLIKQESNEGTRSLSKALAELDALKTNLRALENEIVELRSQDAVKSRREAEAKRAAVMPAPVDHRAAAADPVATTPRAKLKPQTGPQQTASDKSQSPTRLAPTRLAATRTVVISPAANELVARFSKSGEDAASATRAAKGAAAKIPTPPPLTGVKLIDGIKQPGGARQVAPAAKTAIAKKLAAKTLVSKKIAAKTPVAKTSAVTNGGPSTQSLRTSLGEVKQQGAAAKRVAGKPTTATTAAIAKAKKTVVVSRRITAPTVDEFGGPGELTWPATEGPASDGITTGSVKRTAPIKFGAPVVKRAVKRKKKPALAVALASGPSVASLRLHWLALTDRFGAELAGLQPRYVRSGKRGDKRYRLVAGPLRSGAEALQICSQLADNNISCKVSTLKGRRL